MSIKLIPKYFNFTYLSRGFPSVVASVVVVVVVAVVLVVAVERIQRRVVYKGVELKRQTQREREWANEEGVKWRWRNGEREIDR